MFALLQKLFFSLLFLGCTTWAMEPDLNEDMRSMSQVLTSIEAMVLEGLPVSTMPPQGPISQDMALRLAEIVHAQCTPTLAMRVKRVMRLLRQYHDGLQADNRIETSRIICPETLRELDIFSGSHPDHRSSNLVQKTHQTVTDVGLVTYCKNLAYLKTVEEIADLQSKVQLLSDVPDLLDSMSISLGDCHVSEGSFLSFWLSTEPGQSDLLADILRTKESHTGVHGREWLNSSSAVCELKEVIALLGAGAGVILAPVGLIGGIFTGSLVVIIGGAYFTYDQLTGLPNTYSNIKCMFMYNYLMQEKLIALAALVKKMEAMHKLLHGRLPDELISPLLLPSTSRQVKDLLGLLKTNTFKDAASYVSHWGRIHVAYRLMDRCRDEFLGAYATLGELDFLASIAKRLTSPGEGLPHCRATLLRGAGAPSIRAVRVWNPFLNPDSAVVNDIEVGTQGHPPSIIITGPNARGKTTILRSVGINSIMAQTLTIATAENFSLTPLYVLTSINVQDNIAAGASLFVAGVRRMASIARAIALPGFYLILADEPFVGTGRDMAEPTARASLEQLGSETNTLLLATSHLRRVRELEAAHPDVFANYFVARGYSLQIGTDYTEEDYNEVAYGIIAEEMGDAFLDLVRAGAQNQTGAQQSRMDNPMDLDDDDDDDDVLCDLYGN